MVLVIQILMNYLVLIEYMAAMGVAMTHDELLTRAEGEWWDENNTYHSILYYNLSNAVIAVVKRHHPFEFHLGDVISEIQCAECNKKYPCNTIIDIEKELQ
jgi:hypothetical protein